jgi:uncharacterized glyoxalase superfamily protein PhnB
MKPAQLRIARPTHQLEAITFFYCDVLGFEQVGSFTDHHGYDGVMLSLPGREYHLEFTAHKEGSPCPAPSRDNLLVFYFADEHEYKVTVKKIQGRGVPEVEPENPYWKGKAFCCEDPDGWGIVLFKGEYQFPS